MSIAETMMRIVESGGEEFLLARDKRQAESMRVMAFNLKRKVPKHIVEDIGIQKLEEDGKFFLRIYKRDISEAQLWVRDPKTGKLTPIEKDKIISLEDQRIIRLMSEAGKSKEEIQEALANE